MPFQAAALDAAYRLFFLAGSSVPFQAAAFEAAYRLFFLAGSGVPFQAEATLEAAYRLFFLAPRSSSAGKPFGLPTSRAATSW